jgi:hypothetical protein
MKTWSLILFLCISAFCAEIHDTVYVEQITRDTVYIPIKAKTDTIYIKKDVSNPRPEQPKCCPPTERNPFGEDTTKYLRYDTNYTHHAIYVHFDLISIVWLLDSSFTSIGGNIELSFNHKKSLMFNFRYSKMGPGPTSDVFNSSIYKGNISQYDAGLGYRYYFRPSKYSAFLDIGGNWLIRKYDYVNTWDSDPHLYNNRPHTRHETGTSFAPYIHMGHIFRGNRGVFGIEYGLAYNAVDKDLLRKEISYITAGLQLDFRVNFGMGIF